ncbi:MAG TPA: hypothetical protein VMD59_10485, partial [Acidimicrobiales bacterium]|nr:hypothetical protein [Acidimicrobiales bacterium]
MLAEDAGQLSFWHGGSDNALEREDQRRSPSGCRSSQALGVARGHLGTDGSGQLDDLPARKCQLVGAKHGRRTLEQREAFAHVACEDEQPVSGRQVVRSSHQQLGCVVAEKVGIVDD